VSVLAPDPAAARAASVAELHRLGMPAPPENFPLVWEPGDEVELRPVREIEARAAVLNVVMARCFGMPQEMAMSWLLGARLVEEVTPPEWQFVVSGKGDHRSFVLHLEAMFALAWLLGLVKHLDPLHPPDQDLMKYFPNLPADEAFSSWRARTLAAQREPRQAAAMLDFYYCLDWAFMTAEKEGQQLPGQVDSNAIGQRRWALEWAVVFRGPFHGQPGSWEEVDLST
jgi:Domain of unknown function (DUF4272)